MSEETITTINTTIETQPLEYGIGGQLKVYSGVWGDNISITGDNGALLIAHDATQKSVEEWLNISERNFKALYIVRIVGDNIESTDAIVKMLIDYAKKHDYNAIFGTANTKEKPIVERNGFIFHGMNRGIESDFVLWLKQFKKGGQPKSKEEYTVRSWETEEDYARPDHYNEAAQKFGDDKGAAIRYADGLYYNKAMYGVEVVDKNGESVYHLSVEMKKGGHPKGKQFDPYDPDDSTPQNAPIEVKGLEGVKKELAKYKGKELTFAIDFIEHTGDYLIWKLPASSLDGLTANEWLSNIEANKATFKKGGQPASARARERKYTSREKWEQDYRKNRTTRIRYYKHYKNGGNIFNAQEDFEKTLEDYYTIEGFSKQSEDGITTNYWAQLHLDEPKQVFIGSWNSETKEGIMLPPDVLAGSEEEMESTDAAIQALINEMTDLGIDLEEGTDQSSLAGTRFELEDANYDIEKVNAIVQEFENGALPKFEDKKVKDGLVESIAKYRKATAQLKTGGQPASARARERKYTSRSQEWEQLYRKLRATPIRYYKKHMDTGGHIGMEKITKENMIGWNGSYAGNIDDADVAKVKKLKLAMEKNLSSPVPMEGDRIHIKGRNGKEYKHGHMETEGWTKKGFMSVCTNPSTPFVDISEKGKPYFSTSGGYWEQVDTKKMKDTGRTETKWFWTWGSYGRRASGGIYFPVTVKVWEITDEKFYRDGGVFEDEPDWENDDVISEVRNGYSVVSSGKFIGEYPEFDAALAALNEEREGSNWQPTIWSVNERGNYHAIDEEGNEIKGTGRVEHGGKMKTGGRPKSAWVRDHTYISREDWEQNYKGKHKDTRPRYYQTEKRKAGNYREDGGKVYADTTYRHGSQIQHITPDHPDFAGIFYPKARAKWSEWTRDQRMHFLSDHFQHMASQWEEIAGEKFDTVPPLVAEGVAIHLYDGEYAEGGTIVTIQNYRQILPESLHDLFWSYVDRSERGRNTPIVYDNKTLRWANVNEYGNGGELLFENGGDLIMEKDGGQLRAMLAHVNYDKLPATVADAVRAVIIDDEILNLSATDKDFLQMFQLIQDKFPEALEPPKKSVPVPPLALPEPEQVAAPKPVNYAARIGLLERMMKADPKNTKLKTRLMLVKRMAAAAPQKKEGGEMATGGEVFTEARDGNRFLTVVRLDQKNNLLLNGEIDFDVNRIPLLILITSWKDGSSMPLQENLRMSGDQKHFDEWKTKWKGTTYEEALKNNMKGIVRHWKKLPATARELIANDSYGYGGNVAGDPRKMQAKFASTCSKCKKPIKKGEMIVYFPRGKEAMHETCGEADYQAFLSSAADESVMGGYDNPYETGGGVHAAPSGYDPDAYKKKMPMVEVIFDNPKYNYSTSMSAQTTEQKARDYFVGQSVNIEPYPSEKKARVIDIKYHAPGTYARGAQLHQDRPHLTTAKFHGICGKCGMEINEGEEIYRFPLVKQEYHKVCGNKDYQMGGGGEVIFPTEANPSNDIVTLRITQ